MKRLVAALTLAAGLATGAANAAGLAGKAEPTPQALLTDAILCKGDPLAIVRKLAASGSQFDRGFAAATFGEEMDEMDVVLLRSPLEIAGARTSAILLTLAQNEDDFGALVYGRFRGDYRKAVSALKLAPTAKKDGLRLGRFTRALAVDVDGRPDKVCPMTLALTPREDGTFLLGCGWCNG